MRVAIAEGGPIFVGFQVYEDFMTYSGGVYSHASGGAAGGHAVTIIGWGETDSGLKYWICQNSWGSHWGENVRCGACSLHRPPLAPCTSPHVPVVRRSRRGVPRLPPSAAPHAGLLPHQAWEQRVPH